MRNNRFLAALGVSAALAAGGLAAVVFTTPSAGAQTPTTQAPTSQPGTSTPPSTTAPDNGSGRPHNCPNMGNGSSGGSSSSSSSTSGGTNQIGFGRGFGAF
jgi:hypothetical protein